MLGLQYASSVDGAYEKSNLMHQSTGFQQTLPHFLAEKPAGSAGEKPALRAWARPTFSEFVRQVEREFGDTVDLTSLYLTRGDGDEVLSPRSVRVLCDLLGVPPEDFGV